MHTHILLLFLPMQTALVVPGLLAPFLPVFGSSTSQIYVPDFGKLVGDAGKLLVLDGLLRK